MTRQGPLSVANRRVPGERQTAAFGASLSLPDAPAKVPFTIRFADLRRIADRNLRPGEPPEGQLHRGEGQERIGSPSLSTEAWIFAARHLLAGAGAHLIVFAARFSADLTDWLSRTAAARLASWPSARATPCAVRTGSSPKRHHAGTCERSCRPSIAVESGRGADGAAGSQCAANREWRSAYRSCGVARPAMPRGSGALTAPTSHPSDRSGIRRPPADISEGVPPSTTLFAVAVSRGSRGRPPRNTALD